MSILGLTIDYGPYGFMDQFNSSHICNASGHQSTTSCHLFICWICWYIDNMEIGAV